MLLYCVRHGESTYNAEGRVQGQSDVPLSELGLRQGHAVAAALRQVPIEKIVSSPLQRAYKTAEIAAEMLSLKICTDDRLKELNAGVFQDRLRSELEKLYPKELARWSSGDPEFAIPGGESRNDLKRRGMEVLRAIAAGEHQIVAVVGHGRLLITALKGFLGIPLEAEPQSLRNGSITRIEVNGDGQPRLVAIDEVDHLSHLGLAGRGDL
jgi:broad specificity phosphatase PhoE